MSRYSRGSHRRFTTHQYDSRVETRESSICIIACARLVIAQDELANLKEVAEDFQNPSHAFMVMSKTKIHLFEGVRPDEHGNVIGRFEMKYQFIIPRARGQVMTTSHLINVYPLEEGVSAESSKEVRLIEHPSNDFRPNFAYTQRYGPDSHGAAIYII